MPLENLGAGNSELIALVSVRVSLLFGVSVHGPCILVITVSETESSRHQCFFFPNK